MKFLKYLLYALLAVSAAISIVFYGSGYADGMVSLVLNWSLVLIVCTLISAICLPLFFGSGKGMKGSLIKLGLVVVICVVSYLAASGDAVQTSTTVETTASTWKLTDAGLVMTSILFVVAILAILSGSVISTIRNR